jgi:catechol 2,3-dioxygenase-like lactoylglutathione lyase family enzyme
MKLEVVAVPVSDLDRAKDLYRSLGSRLDADFVAGPDFQVIQMNPPGSGCAIIVGTGITSAASGSAQGLTTPPRDIRAGGIRLPDWPGRGAAPRAAVAHGKHDEETRSVPRNAAHRARGRAADVAALAVHIITSTAPAGATYDIDGGQQLIPTSSE